MASYYSLYEELYSDGEGDVWINEPTITGVIIYSIITPCICVLGIVGSSITLIVHLRHELKASIYTYLAVLAFADLAISTLLLVSGLCKGALWYGPGFPQYDAIIALPLGGVFTCIAISATVFVCVDRVVLLWNPRRIRNPKFCKRQVARKLMMACVIFAVLINIPYCFIFTWNNNGSIRTTSFFKSAYYEIHNWFKFSLYGLIPFVILILGNGFLIYSTRKAQKMRIKCHDTKNSRNNRRAREQRRTTITLIAIVFFFIIGEFPTQFISRKSAVSILFGGDETKANRSKQLETTRQVAIILNAASIAVNFFLYCMFCPPFNKALRKLARKASMMKLKKNVLHADNNQVNVFVVNNAKASPTNGCVDMSRTSNLNIEINNISEEKLRISSDESLMKEIIAKDEPINTAIITKY